MSTGLEFRAATISKLTAVALAEGIPQKFTMLVATAWADVWCHLVALGPTNGMAYPGHDGPFFDYFREWLRKPLLINPEGFISAKHRARGV